MNLHKDYWIKYTDGTVREITLPEDEIDWYVHTEGDHVLEYGEIKGDLADVVIAPD